MKTIKYDPNTSVGEQAELSARLAEASDMYYNSGETMMSDAEFDSEMERLRKMEEESGFAYDVSPSVSVGAEVSDGLAKSEHEKPALSLGKVKYVDREELVDWLGDREGVLSWKMDGLTLVATYENGRLEKVVTRGNGFVGSDVTRNARRFEGLPVSIPYDGRLVVRGEGTMTNAEFERVNERAGGIYENARNLAGATIQLLDPKEASEREIRFSAFTLVVPEPSDGPKDEDERLSWLDSLGFGTVGRKRVNAGNVLETIEEMKEAVAGNESPTDGLVLAYADAEYAESLGSTGHHPRGSIAMKWTDETSRTTVREIEWSVGRTGAITPVAVFDEVRMGLGSNVTRASLHNLSVMENVPSLDGNGTNVCGVGSEADVYMANMIIPQVRSCTAGKVEIPTKCPVCGGEVEIRDNGRTKVLFCSNPDCAAKRTKSLASFASKEGVGVDGLSEAKVEFLASERYVTREADFYSLKDDAEKVERLKKADGWGEKSVENLLASVEKSRDVDLPHFLYSLSIPLVGRDLSRKLSAVFHGRIEEFLDFLNDPNEEFLSGYDGIGETKAGNVAAWCRERSEGTKKGEDFRALVAEMRFEKPKEANEENASSLAGLTFVITGSVGIYANRNEFKASVEARGGKVAGSVSSKTNFLVNNDVESTSGKNKKAKELGIPIISEAEFVERFGK